MNHHNRLFRFSPFSVLTPLGAALVAGFVLLTQACAPVVDDEGADPVSGFVVEPRQPADITGGAIDADLSQAAAYAWAQMIAMNWAAAVEDGKVVRRGLAAGSGQTPSQSRTAPRVWQTLRAKTELFPGVGAPHGAEEGAASDFGYDRPPLYRYDPASVGSYTSLGAGLVPACEPGQQGQTPPWVELSEVFEVGPEKLFAAMAPAESVDNPLNTQRVLFGVKVNRSLYSYVVKHGWLDGGNPGSTIPATDTAAFITQRLASPAAGDDTLVGLPDGSIQIKSAWRQLNDEERVSGRFLTTLARSYRAQDSARSYAGMPGSTDYPCFVDATWGLVGIHFKTRTATAPYYIWSSFEYSDNLVTSDGKSVEDSAGRLLRNAQLPYAEPALSSRNAVAAAPATQDSIQQMSPPRADTQPGKRLYYKNQSGTPTTQGIIAINRRAHSIPDPVVSANEVAHAAIRRFLASPEGRSEVIAPTLLNYKLVGVQWRPADKPVAGQDVTGASETDEVLHYPGIYYLANMMLETSYRLQHYSGIVQHRLPAPNEQLDLQDLITDFDAQGAPVINMAYGEPGAVGGGRGYNMGGCMGCHGQIQLKGYDFSFILRRGRIVAPEMDVSIRLPLIDMVHPQVSK